MTSRLPAPVLPNGKSVVLRFAHGCLLVVLFFANTQVEPITLRIPLPKSGFSAPNLPELNHSQLHAVRSVLQQPLSLIQVCLVKLQHC